MNLKIQTPLTRNERGPANSGASSPHGPLAIWTPGLLGYNVRCARALGALLDVEGNGLPFGQGVESITLDGCVVDEDVLGSIGRSDKAKAFFVTEPLNCSCSHYGYLCLT